MIFTYIFLGAAIRMLQPYPEGGWMTKVVEKVPPPDVICRHSSHGDPIATMEPSGSGHQTSHEDLGHLIHDSYLLLFRSCF